MKLEILSGSKNYTCQVIRLTAAEKLNGLDNLVGANIQGNLCLISKDYPIGELYLFVQAGSELNDEFLKKNNLYRHSNLNEDMDKKGYFEDSGRVKAIKFRGFKSTGILFPIYFLRSLGIEPSTLVEGQEFNKIEGVIFCKKAIIRNTQGLPGSNKLSKVLDKIVDSKLFPEHMDTDHLLKYLKNVDLHDRIIITTKLHGTSARCAYTITQRKLSLVERIAKWFGARVEEEEYRYVIGSRHSIKSVDLEGLSDKQHFYKNDLWTSICRQNLYGKLNKGEAVYFEIIGKEETGKDIQAGYSYGLTKPDMYVYRISQINPLGIEVDLSWEQVKERCKQLYVKYVPEEYVGSPEHYIHNTFGGYNEDWRRELSNKLQMVYLDKPSKLDPNIIEEGVCVRVERYPKPKIYKLKSPLFLIHEGVLMDKGVEDIEEVQ